MGDLYVLARRVLLDALEALGTHRDAAIIVGAQAIYLHTGAADLAIAEYTTDADLAFDPRLLGPTPPLEQALESAGFFRKGTGSVGVWKTVRRIADARDVEVQVDLLVPSSVSPGTGRRAARLLGHDPSAARKVNGLEGALVDQCQMEIKSLQPSVDPRRLTAMVAGPAALLVAKLFKIDERKGTRRSTDKDALDVLRLLQGTPTVELANSMREIRAGEHSAEVGQRAVLLLSELFGTRGSEGAIMAARATRPLMDEAEVRLTCEVLAEDLLEMLAGR